MWCLLQLGGRTPLVPKKSGGCPNGLCNPPHRLGVRSDLPSSFLGLRLDRLTGRFLQLPSRRGRLGGAQPAEDDDSLLDMARHEGPEVEGLGGSPALQAADFAELEDERLAWWGSRRVMGEGQ